MKSIKGMLICLLILTLVLGGCGTSSGPQDQAPSSTSEAGGAEAAGGEQTVIRWLTKVENDAEAAQWLELAEDVTLDHPNIKVNFEYTDWNGYWTKLPVELASGTAPDILYMHAMRTKDYLADGFLPLDSYIADDTGIDLDDFYSGILDAYRIDGALYGLPYDFGPYVIFYNRALFDQYGVPYPDNSMTYEDFLNRAEALTRDGNYGFATLPNIDNVLPQLLCEGVEIINEQGELQIGSTKAAAAIQKVADLINVERVAPAVTDTGNTVWHLEAFQAGNIGMVIDGPWTASRVKEYCDFEAGVCMLYSAETRMTSINGSGFGISKDTQYPEEAYLALASISSPRAQQKLAEWGRALPSRASVRQGYYDANSEILGLREAVEDSCDPSVGIPYYSTKNFQEVYSAINQNLQGVFAGTMEAASAVEVIQTMGDSIIQAA